MSPKEKREKLVAYLLLKVEEADWHGVSDAANDLRELEIWNKALEGQKPFLVEHGIKVSETEIDGRKFVEIRRQ